MKAIEIFADVFGQENVNAFLFERLKEDSERSMRFVCDFVGVDGDSGVKLTQGQNLNERWRQCELDKLAKIKQSGSNPGASPVHQQDTEHGNTTQEINAFQAVRRRDRCKSRDGIGHLIFLRYL
jgi:hypothetical protein